MKNVRTSVEISPIMKYYFKASYLLFIYYRLMARKTEQKYLPSILYKR